MRFFTKFAVAVFLSLVYSAGTAGYTSEPIKPTPQELFQPVKLATLVPVITGTQISPTPIIVNQPEVKVRIIEKSVTTNYHLSGNASWYCRDGQSPCSKGFPDILGVDAYAAAGPKLREALGEDNWRGQVVLVNGIKVKLIDWCQCLYRTNNEKIIDLYYDVFKITGGNVKITW